MKRFLTSIFFLTASLSTLMAQYTVDGYYRIRNFGTKRYMYVTDNTGSYDMNRDVGDFAAIQLWKGEDKVISDPSTLMYVTKKGAEQFDLTCQGTGIYAMVKRYVDVHTISTGAFKGSYTVSATEYNITKYLSDNETSSVERGTLGTGASSPYRNWEVFMVSAESDNNYFGIKPNTQVGDKYYYPLYMCYPFDFYSSGMKAYTISKVDRGYAVMKEASGIVPAYTGVLIECSSANAADNRLNLQRSSASPAAGNMLKGVLFCNNQRPNSKDAITAFDSQTMRVLGTTSEGKLGFVTQSPNLVTFNSVQYLPANQSYLSVPAGTEAELTLVTEAEYEEIISNLTYTLTYLVDGKVYKTETLKAGQAIIPQDALTKEGYTFSGWSSIPETMPAEDFTVTGSFTANIYTLTYVIDGETYRTVSVPCGTKITAVTPTSRTGYTFSGWQDLPATMPAGDVTVNGTYTKNSYQLTYLLDGEVYWTDNVEYGSELTLIDSPQREGCTFSGWSTLPATMPASDVNITGSFTPNEYMLTYYVDGQVYRTLTITYGSPVEPLSLPQKEGYTFSGWDAVPQTMPASDVQVNGSFSVNSYTLTYTVDGVIYETQTITFGAAIEPLAEPTREGYRFSGWGEVPATMPANDLTLAGTFSICSYTAIFVLNGAGYDNQTIQTSTYTFGAAVSAPSVPSKSGYTFQGWANLPETMPASDVTIVGTYQANEYTVTYMIDGEVYQYQKVPYGATIETVSVPEKEGYTFGGWNSVPATMPARNITVQGHFSINSYTVTLILNGGKYDNYVYKVTTYTYGSKISMPGMVPPQSGYTFMGWSEVPSSMPAHDVTIIGTYSDGTGISSVGEDAPERIVYDLSGRRITSENLPRGIYIINGKKTYVK